jgi:hypothetical protein
MSHLNSVYQALITDDTVNDVLNDSLKQVCELPVACPMIGTSNTMVARPPSTF